MHEGKRDIPVQLEIAPGLIRIYGPSINHPICFVGQLRQTRCNRLGNWWRLSSGLKKPLRCAFHQIRLDDASRILIDPGWPYDESLVLNIEGGGKAVLAEWTRGKLNYLFNKDIRLVPHETGFSIVESADNSVITTVPWHEVRAIRTFKRDLMCYDMICLSYQLTDKSWIETWETNEGFLTVAEQARAVFPDIPEDWYNTVMMPPFATNDALLYCRDDESGDWQE